jgi:CRP/FNR family cyclic AMP-dependent transcriptional regulator
VATTTKAVVESLRKVPLFSGCSTRELQTIARAVKPIQHPAGTVIAREGEPGIGLFVIQDGTAEVTIGGRTKATLGSSDFFGEIALLDGGQRTATATSVTPVSLLILGRREFNTLLKEFSDIRTSVLMALAQRVRRLENTTD